MKKILAHPLFSGSALMIGGSMAINSINYLYHFAMGRILAPVNYGVLASLFSLLYMISIVPLSTSISIVKFISAAKEKNEVALIYQSINKLIFNVALVSSIILIGFSPLIARFLNIKEFYLVSLVGVVSFFSLITLVNQATSQGLLKFKGVIVPNFISAFFKLILGIFLVYIGWSVFGAMIGILVSLILAYLNSRIYVRTYVKKIKNKKYNLKPFLKYALPVLLQALAFTSLFTTDLILVKHYFPPFEAGLYAALSTLGKVIYFASSPVAQTMFPIVSGRKSRGESYKKIFIAAFLVTGFISFSVLFIYLIFPELAIVTLFGKRYLSAVPYLVWMGLFLTVYTLCYLMVNFLLSIGRVKIVIFPLIASLFQIFLISMWHNSLLLVIQISFLVSLFLFLGMLLYAVYSQVNEKK